jgi:hypothetical protein
MDSKVTIGRGVAGSLGMREASALRIRLLLAWNCNREYPRRE